MKKKLNSKPPATVPKAKNKTASVKERKPLIKAKTDIKVKKKSPSNTTPLEALAVAYDITIFQAISAIGNPVLWEIIGGEVIGGGEAERGPAAAIHEYLQGYAAKAKKKSK
ncbi:MAG: hypothetical protein M1276_02305 [Deltaproteobacteria bacterium]|jgi:hypothetical protein|nr:hypothetical protein [Deltaproteobacteria bacterium]